MPNNAIKYHFKDAKIIILNLKSCMLYENKYTTRILKFLK